MARMMEDDTDDIFGSVSPRQLVFDSKEDEDGFNIALSCARSSLMDELSDGEEGAITVKQEPVQGTAMTAALAMLRDDDDDDDAKIPLPSLLPPPTPSVKKEDDDDGDLSPAAIVSKKPVVKNARKKNLSRPYQPPSVAERLEPVDTNPVTTSVKVEMPAVTSVKEAIKRYPVWSRNSRSNIPMPMVPHVNKQQQSSPQEESKAIKTELPENAKMLPPDYKYEKEYMQSLMDATQQTVLVPEGTLSHTSPAVFGDMLKSHAITIPISTASHESKLLRPAGRHRYEVNGFEYIFPECPKGKLCFGYTHGHNFPRKPDVPNEGKFIMCAYMDEDELSRFLLQPLNVLSTSSSATSMSIPKRKCVLCQRYDVCNLVFKRRGNKPTIIPDRLINTYQNIFCVKDGYKDEVKCPENLSVFEGISGSHAMIRYPWMTWTMSLYGVPLLDQSAMIWGQPDPVRPVVGETFTGYMTRAGCHPESLAELTSFSNAKEQILKGNSEGTNSNNSSSSAKPKRKATSSSVVKKQQPEI